MSAMRTFAFALLALAAACSSEPQSQPDVAPVVAAERAFAAAAQQGGWVEAFENYSTADAIVLQAGPVNARQSLAGIDPANRGDTSLNWGPQFAGVSSGGDFGFTTGPYNGGGAAFGQYFTVWRRQADGSWKWIYDGGTNQTTPTTVNAAAQVEALPIGARGAGTERAAIESVLREEGELARAAAANAGDGYRAVFAGTGRMNRDNQPTALGRDAAATLASATPVAFSPPQIVQSSANGDMVFALGQARWEGGSGYYCRIWVLQGEGWRIGYDQILLRTLDELNATPEP
ncbi:MAG: hypothetical protein M0D54_14510 [Hyphomonadaceae bacterium JAD_PAG50586_4]|nr:MAG: hypothetical protein M0D54_14510 [Hyphomonadaceae bacterium JAD_PAG50586_4]